MTTDEEMNRRDFLRITGVSATAGVAGATGTVAAQEGGNNTTGNTTTGNQTGTPTGNQTGTPTGNQTGTPTGNQTGTSTGGSGGGSGPIDYGGYLGDAKGWGGSGSTSDKTGQGQVTIKVGAGSNGKAFKPAGVHIDSGTKVVWEWTGKGGNHNVVGENKDFTSGSATANGTFEKTFNEEGIVKYYCNPHQGQGMLGAVAVGQVPRKAPVTPATPAVSQSTKNLGVATFATMVSTLGLAYFFLRYGGDYEQ